MDKYVRCIDNSIVYNWGHDLTLNKVYKVEKISGGSTNGSSFFIYDDVNSYRGYDSLRFEPLGVLEYHLYKQKYKGVNNV